MCLLVIFVLKQLTVPTGESVTRLTKQLQRLLLVDVAEHRLLCGHTYCFWDIKKGHIQEHKVSLCLPSIS